jgi:hypothetical protein
LTPLAELPPLPQKAIAGEPYDSWVRPDGQIAALFYRRPEGYLVRFPDQADFTLDGENLQVQCRPASEDMRAVAHSLYQNAIVPMVGNFLGELNLHGSAVVVDGRAVAFIGQSRRGKTTLAGAFARAGHPFLTEDVVALQPAGSGYMVRPSRPVLRLFPDSARFLLDDAAGIAEADGKRELPSGASIPFHEQSAPLAHLYILGDGSAQSSTITGLSPQLTLTEILRHAFVLDVNRKDRLKGHFERLAAFALATPCFEMDYPRDYDKIPDVIGAVRKHLKETISQ